MKRARALISVLAIALALVACGDGSVDRPVHTAGETTEGGGMKLTSPAFQDEASIPAGFTCDGDDVSPPLAISDVPADAEVLALIMDDPDAPSGTWDHWVAYDIPVTEEIPEGVADLGTPGRNSWGRSGYGGPCPPGGTHRYYFTVYALDTRLGLDPGSDKAAVLEAIEGHVLAEATLMGRYSR